MEGSTPHSSTAGVGKRFAALKRAFQRATGTGFTEMSLKEFEACFPPTLLSEEWQAAVYDAYRQVLQLSRANSEAEYEDIVEECQLWSKLAALEQLCAEQGVACGGAVSSTGANSAPQPEAAALQSRVNAMTAERELLTAQLAQLAQQQAEAAAALDAKKQEVAASADKLRAIPQQLGGLAAAGHSWNMQPVEPVM